MELTLPLFILASSLDEEILIKLIETIKKIVVDKKADDFTENMDVSLIDFLSQELENDYFAPVSKITSKFKEYLQSNEEWINPKWMVKALKRLNLIKDKKRTNRGIEIKLDYKKAQEKIKIFKWVE